MTKEKYLELFQTEANKKFSKAAQELADLKNGLAELRNYQKSEKENIVNREKEIAEKEATLDSTLSDARSCDDFKDKMQSYRDKLVSLKSDLQTSRGMVLQLEKTIPKRQTIFEKMSHRLQTAIDGFVREKRIVADEQLKEWMMKIIEERESFLSAFRQIYVNFGVSFILHDETLMPGKLTMGKIDDIRKRLGIEALAVQPQPQPQSQPRPQTSFGKGGQALNRETREFLDRNEQKRQAESKNKNNAKTASKQS